jgi:hypothetical protein
MHLVWFRQMLNHLEPNLVTLKLEAVRSSYTSEEPNTLCGAKPQRRPSKTAVTRHKLTYRTRPAAYCRSNTYGRERRRCRPPLRGARNCASPYYSAGYPQRLNWRTQYSVVSVAPAVRHVKMIIIVSERHAASLFSMKQHVCSKRWYLSTGFHPVTSQQTHHNNLTM